MIENPMIKRLDSYSNSNYELSEAMTPSGTLNKLFFMALIMLAPALISWNWFAQGAVSKVELFMWIGVITGFILSLIISFKPRTAPYLAPLYAVAEGMFIGGISAVFEAMFPGIVIQAVAATIGTVFVMVSLYRTNLIKVDQKFYSIMLILLGSISVIYLTSIVTSIFGYQKISAFLWSASPISIAFSVGVCVVAALSLLSNFKSITVFSEHNAPKYMEWYCATGLLITIVWLYIEILRLIYKLKTYFDR